MMMIAYGSGADDDDCSSDIADGAIDHLSTVTNIIRPVIKTWRLNERMYGALEGHSKPGAVSH